jgi:hypothetical protein
MNWHTNLCQCQSFSGLYTVSSISSFEDHLLNFFLMKYSLGCFMHINTIPNQDHPCVVGTSLWEGAAPRVSEAVLSEQSNCPGWGRPLYFSWPCGPAMTLGKPLCRTGLLSVGTSLTGEVCSHWGNDLLMGGEKLIAGACGVQTPFSFYRMGGSPSCCPTISGPGSMTLTFAHWPPVSPIPAPAWSGAQAAFGEFILTSPLGDGNEQPH